MHDVYLWVKFLHVGATVLFAGWIWFAPFWLHHALRGDGHGPRKRMTTLALACVLGGGGLLWGTGALMARVLSPEAFTLYWLQAGSVVSLAIMFVWILGLLPIYRHLFSIPSPSARSPRLINIALCGAILCAILTVAILWMMVVRPI